MTSEDANNQTENENDVTEISSADLDTSVDDGNGNTIEADTNKIIETIASDTVDDDRLSQSESAEEIISDISVDKSLEAVTSEPESIEITDPAITPTSEPIPDRISKSEATSKAQSAPVPNYQDEGTPMTDTTTPAPSEPVVAGNFEEWILDPSGLWPPPIFLKKNVTPRERFYLEYRWHSQWSYYDTKATQNKNTYYWYQRFVVIGSLIIPALVSLNSAMARFINDIGLFGPASDSTETMIRIGVDSVTVFVSLLVAGSAALESLYKYGENWSSYRSAAEELQAEKNFYDMSAGPYENNPNPFATFVTRIEGIVANQNGKYFQAVQSQIAKQTEHNQNMVEAFLTGDEDEEKEGEVEATIVSSTPTSAG